jgi:DNA-binding winged helix-turn-helix (wHTH) protein
MAVHGHTFRFERFVLDAVAYRLTRDGVVVSLGPKALDVLLFLVGRAGALVSKTELLEALWPGVFVTENTLTQAISDVRQALGDRADAPRFIETVPRRGYRFVCPVANVPPADPSREASGAGRARETASLEAYRAFTEGRLRLEALDAAHAREAVRDFERALAHDPDYAYAYAGLASAQFFLFETSRAQNRPDAGLLATALAHARRAAALDPDLAEAHATLSMILASTHASEEAVAAARRAVALAPEHWRNHYRLGHAAWGSERLRALTDALALYPDFAYAHFEAAMVHIARLDLPAANAALEQGVTLQRAQAARASRFPARGLFWLLALTRLAADRLDEALSLCEEEIAAGGTQLYAAEFVMNAHDARGFAWLHGGAPARARDAFAAATDLFPGHARSRLGLATALRACGRLPEADVEVTRAREAIEALEAGGRRTEAALMRAFDHTLSGDAAAATTTLARLLTEAPPGHAGWTIPIEPYLRPLHSRAAFEDVLKALARRAT